MSKVGGRHFAHLCWGIAKMSVPPCPRVPVQRIRKCWGTASLVPALPCQVQSRGKEGVGVQLFRFQPFTGHLYQDRGLGGVGVQLLRLQPLLGHLCQDRGFGGVGVQLFRLQPFTGHLYQDRGFGGIVVHLSGSGSSLASCTLTEVQEVLGSIFSSSNPSNCTMHRVWRC